MEGQRPHGAAAAARPHGIVGRERELAAAEAFLDGEMPAVLVVSGAAGIGKSTIWDETVARARQRGMTVLQARPIGAEVPISYAALGDLLRPVPSAAVESLPEPQRRALAVALLREDAEEAPMPGAVGLATLAVLRELAADAPLLVAVDDVQWVDAVSAAVLGFAARRLEGLAVRLLLAHRSGTDAPLLGSVSVEAERLEVAALGVGALRQIVYERVTTRLTRRLVNRVVDAAAGNPLFALELAREAGNDPEPGSIAIPDGVESAVAVRVAELEPDVARCLLAIASVPAVTVEMLDAVAGTDAVDRAIELGVVEVEEGRARAAHPLLAEAAVRGSAAAERRRVRAALADVVDNADLRALLRASASTRPDEEVARDAHGAAERAGRRGAVDDAVELAGHALRLTPAGSDERAARVLALAQRLSFAGYRERFLELMARELDALPSGPPKAEAYVALAAEAVAPNDIERYVELAMAEAPDDRGLRAACTSLVSLHQGVIRLRDVPGAEARLRAVVPDMHVGRPALEGEIVTALVWLNHTLGHAVDTLPDRYPELERPLDKAITCRAVGARLVARGEVAAAREHFARLLAEDEYGDLMYALNRAHLCEVELRAGRWDEAERVLAEWRASAESGLMLWPVYERCRAAVALGRGDVPEARTWAELTVERARERFGAFDELAGTSVLGVAALLAGEPALAVEHLGRVWAHVLENGVGDPGLFPVAPDLVEALVALERLEEAAGVAAELRALAEPLGHPWGLASARRCDAMVRARGETFDAAYEELGVVASEYEALELAFDAARCRLAAGRAARRQRKWALARASLEEAMRGFDAEGSAGWTAVARDELARVGARRPAAEGLLSPAEQRVAALAAEGRSNKEIAAALHLSVHTVELHLSRVYRKLGIGSRRLLASRLADDPGA